MPGISLHRWDEIALEKVTEMISRKIVSGDREMLAQIYEIKLNGLEYLFKPYLDKAMSTPKSALGGLPGGPAILGAFSEAGRRIFNQ